MLITHGMYIPVDATFVVGFKDLSSFDRSLGLNLYMKELMSYILNSVNKNVCTKVYGPLSLY